jgi:hypothetical protein
MNTNFNDYFKNDFTKGFEQFFAVQSNFVKQAAEVNKKLAVEVLKNTKTVVESYAQNIDETIKKLTNNA